MKTLSFFWRSHQFSDQTAAFSPSILDFTQPEFLYVRAGPGPTFGSRRPGNTASFEQLSKWWRTVGNTVFDLIGQRFESQTSRSRNERVTARPTGWSRLFIIGFIVPLRPWILFVAYRFFFSAWIVRNKSLLKYKNYQCFPGALVFDLRSQAQMVTYYNATTSN